MNDNSKKLHPAAVIGAVVLGSLLLRGCSPEGTEAWTNGTAFPSAGSGGGNTSGNPQWQSSAPPPENTGGDYIHRTNSGITVGGDGNGNWYVGDNGSGRSVANDGN